MQMHHHFMYVVHYNFMFLTNCLHPFLSLHNFSRSFIIALSHFRLMFISFSFRVLFIMLSQVSFGLPVDRCPFLQYPYIKVIFKKRGPINLIYFTVCQNTSHISLLVKWFVNNVTVSYQTKQLSRCPRSL